MGWFQKIFYRWIYKSNLVANTQISKEDERDFVLTTNQNFPENYYIQHNIPIRNQSSIGSCMSHAAIRAIEIQVKTDEPNNYVEGSELFHYFMTRKYVNKTYPKNAGMTVRDGCKTCYSYGFCPEKLWKYIIRY